MKKHLLILTAATLILAGCQSVPQTEIGFNKSTGTLAIKSPKEIDIDGLEIEVVPGKKAVVKIKKYSSHNSPDVIAAVASSNERMAAYTLQIAQALAQSGAKAVAPVPVPPLNLAPAVPGKPEDYWSPLMWSTNGQSITIQDHPPLTN
jgi:nitrous oxide reductase accessory protein NosL